MHKNSLYVLSFLLFALHTSVSAESTHAIGFGAHYWNVIDDVDVNDIDESGVAYLGVYRYDGGLIALHAELEVFPEDFAGTGERLYSPQGLIILGDSLYAGLGAGILYSDGEFADRPFFMIRAGINITAFGPVSLDINANYVFTDFDDLSGSDFSSDTLTLGAMIRFEFN